MKETKICIIATAITMIILISCACAMPAYAAGELELHPKLAVVVDTEKVDNLWLVYCQDREGDVWTFWDDEGTWAYGDIVNLLMQELEEDEIIEVYWEGYTENVQLFFQTMGWR